MVGALSRSATGWVSDKWGGGRVTIWVFILMMIGCAGVLYFLGIKDQPNAFWGFFAMFLLLFFAAGVGNASTFQMIPNIMRKEMDRLMPEADAAARVRQSEKESAAITGFTSAIAAFGAFFIPKSYGTSIGLTGGVEAAGEDAPTRAISRRSGHVCSAVAAVGNNTPGPASNMATAE